MSPRLSITPPPAAAHVEFRLVVSIGTAGPWRALVVGPDAIEHEFSSPFELARFVAWPAPAAPVGPPGGLR